MAKGFKTGGRQRGTENRVTKDIRLVLKDVVEHELGQLSKNLKELSPKDRLDVVTKLLPYVMPKAEAASVPSQESESPNFYDTARSHILDHIHQNREKGILKLQD